MADSFFRKVVRFVANPATEWSELSSRQDESRELELEKSELKAMIERKRRNDFVRKREFDMLRRVRREGLTPEQLAALGSSSRLDDAESRTADGGPAATPGVKAKIDEIEQQMVGDASPASLARRGRPAAPPAPEPPPWTRRDERSPGATAEAIPAAADRWAARAPAVPPAEAFPAEPVVPPPFRGGAPFSTALPPPDEGGAVLDWSLPDETTGGPQAPVAPGRGLSASAPSSHFSDGGAAGRTAAGPSSPGAGLPPLAPMAAVSFELPLGGGPGAGASAGAGAPRDRANPFVNPFEVEVSEVVHDPELDEAVIAFANADFGACEDALRRLTAPGGPRALHAETWLVLFDLYRAIGQPQRFESLAMDYAQQFGWSAPQWYSLPQLVAETVQDEPLSTPSRGAGPASVPPAGEVGWVCPPQLDIDAVGRLRSQTLQMPLPWVLDWSGVHAVDPEAAMQLSTLLRMWAGQALSMRWVGGSRLLTVLQEAAPTGNRDADPVYWLTRLEVLRLSNRADQFDETAIDYCVTYEVSPPSWEPARCKVTMVDDAGSSRSGPWSAVSDLPTSFLESHLVEDDSGTETARVELAGQLTGDIGPTLARIQDDLGAAPVIQVSCARLIRVDFIAAGDLLNWVLARGAEQRLVQFVEAHRLVALFFGAMGINEHARVQVRKV